ncbi:MAG: 7-cyano-7-deazaguanine synthase [Nanoarchaeota archaeon]
MRGALVLCSGGIDSVVTAYRIKRKDNYEDVTLLFFDYGQNGQNRELDCVKYHARQLACALKIVKIAIESDSLIHSNANKFDSVRKEQLKDTRSISGQWYVPCRNLLFSAYALSIAEKDFLATQKVKDIFVGFGVEGRDSYPDAGRIFIKDINSISKDICAKAFVMRAPFIMSNKEDIISVGAGLGVNFAKTWSCYSGGEKHCGTCLACALRKHGFYWANISDPTLYAA